MLSLHGTVDDNNRVKRSSKLLEMFHSNYNALYREYTVVSIQVIGSSMSIERIEVGKSSLLRPVT